MLLYKGVYMGYPYLNFCLCAFFLGPMMDSLQGTEFGLEARSRPSSPGREGEEVRQP